MAGIKPRMFVVEGGRNLIFTFCLVSSLFLVWGFCNGMIDVMDKHFQDELHLSMSQSAWVQFAHYLGYFLMALPAGALAQKLGYKGGIIVGLITVAIGGFWFLAATRIAMFWAFLLGVSVIASGLTCLETVANPYTVLLGDARYGSTRINLAQFFNGVGWVLGPIAGSVFFYSADGDGKPTGTQSLYIPYVGIALVVLILALVFFWAHVPNLKAPASFRLADSAAESRRSIWSHRPFAMAVAAQFFYVAAQAGIFSFFINYITSQTPPIPERLTAAVNQFAGHIGPLRSWLSGCIRSEPSGSFVISNKGAANLASAAFICFLLGRFIGSTLMRRFAPHRILALFALMSVLTTLVVFLKLGWFSVTCVFLSYFFMSIMFPTIFALGIQGLGAQTKKASAYLVMAIVGGAILPKLMGRIADAFDVARSFVVPMMCFAFIAFYALWLRRWRNAERRLRRYPACN